MKAGIIICSRYESSRVPGKVFANVNGKPVLHHLLDRLVQTNVKIYIAIPSNDFQHYSHLTQIYGKKIHFYLGSADDPLERMNLCARYHKLDACVRVTHDKAVIDPKEIVKGLYYFDLRKLDYLYSSQFTPGMSFEIISKTALDKAYRAASGPVEHVSYAVKAVTKNTFDMPIEPKITSNARLLIDFPEDLQFLECLFSQVGNDASFKKINMFVKQNKWLNKVNELPQTTVYTCVHNGEEFLERAILSVLALKGFAKMEYIIVDDFSSDKSAYIATYYAHAYSNIKFIRNAQNIGLASSSNVALKKARGKYTCRLDHDDLFTDTDAINIMIKELEKRKLDIVFPGFYHGSVDDIRSPEKTNHPAGALFRTAALNYVKFTDGLRAHDGLDLYERAKQVLNIGYYGRPLFMYSQSDKSMSKTNLIEREETKQRILNGSLERRP